MRDSAALSQTGTIPDADSDSEDDVALPRIDRLSVVDGRPQEVVGAFPGTSETYKGRDQGYF